jgi:ABC-type polysaccharide/polyol phosphate transport system ATPase subunit
LRSPDLGETPAVSCRGVAKQFYLYSHRTTSLREWFIRSALGRPIHVRHAEFSLRDFNLRVDRGETVALVGPNGCGKSTVLRLIAGIYTPTAGSVETSGRIAAVIELGAGFNMELTGAENVELYGSIMGLSRDRLARHYEEIVSFAGIGKFIDTPVKYYSSGMMARLAFSVAVNGQPDILLLDEVLSVGDQSFQEKCFERLRAFQACGGTMVVVSHDLHTVSSFCSRAVWLESGSTRMEGDAVTVVEAYRSNI